MSKSHESSTTRSMALLKLEAKDGPIYFIMDHPRYHPEGSEDSDDDNQFHQRFFFNEHSCPTNWLDECVAVIINNDTDPHGFLKFIRAVDVPEDFDEDQAEWKNLFPEAFES
jgi:hypothetical protein